MLVRLARTLAYIEINDAENWRDYLKHARAVLDDLRDPSQTARWDAIACLNDIHNGRPLFKHTHETQFVIQLNRMIDSILEK